MNTCQEKFKQFGCFHDEYNYSQAVYINIMFTDLESLRLIFICYDMDIMIKLHLLPINNYKPAVFCLIIPSCVQ